MYRWGRISLLIMYRIKYSANRLGIFTTLIVSVDEQLHKKARHTIASSNVVEYSSFGQDQTGICIPEIG